MYRRSRTLAAGLFASATLALLCTVSCNYSEEGKPANPKFATTQIRTLGASGSTFAAPLISRWSDDYEKAHQVQVNYRSIGSGGGIDELKQGTVAFAASDAPLSDDQLKGLPTLVQIPVGAGPVCVIYNLPGLSAPLKLSGKTLAGIFAGEINNWQDPTIVKDNRGARLPHSRINVVHRSDGSGTTNIFTNYLSAVSPLWAAKTGHGLSVNWPVGLGRNGSQAILSTVTQNSGSIGYLELSYAEKAGVPVASIQNNAGEFVVPSTASAALAINAFSDALANDLRTPIVNPPAAANEAYPISGLTFILIPRDNQIPGEQRELKDFIAYALSTGQESAEQLYYAKLPASVQQHGQMLLTQLTENGQPLK